MENNAEPIMLDNNGWPQLPHVGSKIRFIGGNIILSIMGTCTVIRADHTVNAAGKPGGRVVLETDTGEEVTIRLSQVRDYAEIIEDGLDIYEREKLLRKYKNRGCGKNC